MSFQNSFSKKSCAHVTYYLNNYQFLTLLLLYLFFLLVSKTMRKKCQTQSYVQVNATFVSLIMIYDDPYVHSF